MTPTNRYTAFSNLQNLEVTLTLTGLSSGHHILRETFVNMEYGSAYDAWIAMGAPAVLSSGDTACLMARAQPGRLISDITVTDGTYMYRQQLLPLEVRLVELMDSYAACI